MYTIQDVASTALICRHEVRPGVRCGADLRDAIAELLNEGGLKEDGVSVTYPCPACGGKQRVSRSPAPEPAPEGGET